MKGGGVMRKKGIILAIIVTFVFSVMVDSMYAAEKLKRITKEELKGMLSNEDLIILDVRKGGDWDKSDLKIEGAVREDPKEVESWMQKYSKDKTLVFYCA